MCDVDVCTFSLSLFIHIYSDFVSFKPSSTLDVVGLKQLKRLFGQHLRTTVFLFQQKWEKYLNLS